MPKWEYRVLIVKTPTEDVSETPPAGDMSDISEMPWEAERKSFAFLGSYGELAKILNRTGNDGWEVCGTISESPSLIILKRPLAAA